MLWAVRCPRIQYLQCQEGWQLPGTHRPDGGKTTARELSLSSTSQLWHLISRMTLRKLPGLSESHVLHREITDLTGLIGQSSAVTVSGSLHTLEFRECWLPLLWVALTL